MNNRLKGRTLPDGRQESFTYNSIGDLMTHTAFDGTTLYISYDLMGRPILKAWPDGRQSRYTYTPTGQVASVTLGTTAPTISGFQPSGTTNWTYDTLDRVAKVSYPSGQYISYSYDKVGNLTGRATADSSWSYGYDGNHNLISVTDTSNKTTTYTYDVNNRISKTTYPDGTVGYREYDTNGHLLQIAWRNGQGALLNGTVYTLLPNGQRQSLTRYDNNSQLNITSISSTDSSGHVTSAEHWALSSPAQISQYSYDYAQRLTNDQTLGYRHNTEYITAWTYDNVGNRLSQSKTTQAIDTNGNPTGTASTVTTAYSYDVTDRLTQSQDTDGTGSTTTTTYSWDPNGRLIQKAMPSQITQYNWRSDDRLIQVKQGASTSTLQTVATYQYDDNGNRTQRTAYVQDPSNPSGPLIPQITNYLIDETYTYAETLEETSTINPGHATRTLYTWDNDNHIQSANQDTGAMTGPALSYYEQDGLGSILTTSDTTGNIVNSYSYEAFGRSYDNSAFINIPYGFAGEYMDSVVGLLFLRDRWGDANIGRFLKVDSFNGVEFMPISLNQYLYASDNPVNDIDPSGLDSISSADSGGGGLFNSSEVSIQVGGVTSVNKLCAGDLRLQYRSRPLTDNEKAFLAPYSAQADLDNVTLHLDNTWPLYVPEKGHWAVTINNDVFFTDPLTMFNTPWTMGSLGHELYHVWQYRAWILTRPTYGLLALLTLGVEHWNPYEIYAYRHGNQIIKDLNAKYGQTLPCSP